MKPLLFILITLISCNHNEALRNKVFIKNAEQGAGYLYFNDENQYTLVYQQADTLLVLRKSYSYSNNLTFYDFNTANDQQLHEMLGDNIGSLEAYLENGCIYFHYDAPEVRYCPIDKSSLPAGVASALNVNVKSNN